MEVKATIEMALHEACSVNGKMALTVTCERLSQLDEADRVSISRQKRKRLSLSHRGHSPFGIVVPLLHREGNRLAKCHP